MIILMMNMILAWFINYRMAGGLLFGQMTHLGCARYSGNLNIVTRRILRQAQHLGMKRRPSGY